MLTSKIGDKAQDILTCPLDSSLRHLPYNYHLEQLLNILTFHHLLHRVKLSVVNKALVHIGNIHTRDACG